MDEKQISELLECSVCFEQLDQSCKVLPCQHTFCRRCLDEILSRKHELRCPECRTLVTIPVAELHTNILVVRILEGLKTQGHRAAKQWDGGTAQAGRSGGVGSSPSRGLGFSPHRHHHDGHGMLTGYHIKQNQPYAKALYTYESQEKEDLSFKKGDMIVLRRQIDENWYVGELGGRSGFFPANFVQVIVHLPQIPQSKALYDFDLKDEKEKDCLSFKKDEVITVIRRVDQNWLEGRQGDKIGIFPISFVELNDAARMLINSKSNVTNSALPAISTAQSALSSPPLPSLLSSSESPLTLAAANSSSQFSSHPTETTAMTNNSSIPTPLNQIASSIPLSSLSSLSSLPTPVASGTHTDGPLSTTPNSLSTQINSPQTKRHSYTSAATSSSPLPLDASHQRHSMEVTSVNPDSASSSPVPEQLAACSTSSTRGSSPSRTTDVAGASSSESASSPLPFNPASFSPVIPPAPACERTSDNQALSSSSSGGVGLSQAGSLTAPIYVAIYNYHPQKEDELELHKGDHYSVVEKCQDGWFKGSCVKTAQAGVFPGNYVVVYRHSSAFKPMNPNVLNIRAKGPSSPPPGQASSSPTPASPNPASTGSSSQRSESNGNHRVESSSVDLTVTSGPPPPLMPRVAKMTPVYATSSKSKPGSSSSSSHLMAIPRRSMATLGTSPPSSSPSSSFSGANSLSLMANSIKGKTSEVRVPSGHGNPRNKTWTSSSSSSHHHPSMTLSSMSSSSPNPSSSHSSNTTPSTGVMATSHDSTTSLLQSLLKDKKKKKGGFLNLLKDKKSKITSSSTDANPLVSLEGVSHTRSGSFPSDGSASSSSQRSGGPGSGSGGGSGPAIEHRKALSLDSTSSSVPPPVPDKPRTRPLTRNKYCCVAPYPPQMNYELGLEVGDIVYVLRKRGDGWYKGTHERTGKTGMFPGTFVEKYD